jgi:DNA polymerase-3 subunit gamma/tau
MLLNEVIEHGFDGHHFITGLGEHFRNLLVCKDAVTLKLLEVGENIRDRYKNQAQHYSVDFLLKALDIIAKCDVNYKSANNKRLLLELSLMQMCSIQQQGSTFITPVKTETQKPVSKPVVTPVIQQKEKEIIKPVEEKKEEKPVEKTENVIKEPPAKVVKKIVTGTKSILENLVEEEEKKTKDQPSDIEQGTDNEKPKTDFTKEQFDKAWLKFAEHYKSANPDYYITLTSHMPVLKEDYVIELTLDNKVQDKEIGDRKLDILSFLRKELNNYSIQLQTVINKNPDAAKPFTPQEKFKKMAEKNPAIKKLKNEFDLEIDF